LGDVRVEPDFIAIWIENLERPVPPPLQRQRITDRHSLLRQVLVERIDVPDFEIDFNRLLAGWCGRSARCPHEHDPSLAHDDRTEIELTVLADHAHDMAESEGMHVEVPDGVD